MYPILSVFFTIVGMASWLGEGRMMGERGFTTFFGIAPPRTLYQDQMFLDGTTYGGGTLDHHKEMMNPQLRDHSGDHHRTTVTQDFEQERRTGRENRRTEGCDHVEVEGVIRGVLGGDGGGVACMCTGWCS